MQTPHLIAEFLRLVCSEANAQAVGLLFYMEPSESQPLLLVTHGEANEVPELDSEESARQLILQHQDSLYPESALVQTVVSSDPDCVLVRIALDSILIRAKSSKRALNERRAEPLIDTAPRIDGTVWFGLRGCPDPTGFIKMIEDGVVPGGGPTSSLSKLAALTTKFAWNVYQLTGALQDPISQLPGRMEFQVFFKRALSAAKQNKSSIGLLLVNPDDFSMINHRYGRAQGDLAVREIADALADCLRRTDGVFRYVGAVFAVVLPATNMEQCRAAAEKVRKFITQKSYIDDNERLTFSIGVAVAEQTDLVEKNIEVTDMLKQADLALNLAKLSGGARVVQHRMNDELDNAVSANPLTGVFTADTEKDYRNMLLLWETVGLVTANHEPTEMAAALADRLAMGFQPDRLVFFSLDEAGKLEAIASNVRDENGLQGRVSGRVVNLDQNQNELIQRALESTQVERWRNSSEPSASVFTAYAVPFIARDSVIGCMYLDGSGRRLQLDSSDVVFLNALASQMAVALDRAQLAAGWIREKERESRVLREELAELRQTFNQHALIYESEEMHSLLDTLKRVAPSEATVLITGESGTGKEVLAQATHEYSNRKGKPFVVFDCGAVSVNLLEAELFGHVKGAFTGAERASEGRVAQADGGTLFLDEIGELPLQVQAKLLRFVQEKEFSPVGSASNRKVDVRIVAATNRRLQDEVAKGTFRSDLYYRLQVISLQAIPLRHRVVDILPLAKYFLEKFSLQNAVSPKDLSVDAEQKLLAYDWPGNVRELQHCMLRVVLTCDTELISGNSIEFMPESAQIEKPVSVRTTSVLPQEPPTEVVERAEEPGDRWAPLRRELIHQIELALEQNKKRPVPLGRWLTEDLVLAASDVSDQVARRAAMLVGLPESTYRRHYQKVNADQGAGLITRTTSWDRVRPLIDEVVGNAQTGDADPESDLIEEARLVLLEDVLDQVDAKVSVGASLMGVTAPTYKRWIQQRDQL